MSHAQAAFWHIRRASSRSILAFGERMGESLVRPIGVPQTERSLAYAEAFATVAPDTRGDRRGHDALRIESEEHLA